MCHANSTHTVPPQRGFTLIETLASALILAILSSIAWASYRDVLLRAHRGEARTALLQLQAAQERHYLDHLRYSGLLEAAPDADGLGLAATTQGGRTWHWPTTASTTSPVRGRRVAVRRQRTTPAASSRSRSRGIPRRPARCAGLSHMPRGPP